MENYEDVLLHEGILYYTLVEEGDSVNLGISGKSIVADDSVTYIGYYKSNALVFSKEEKHLGINENGILELSSKPFSGFRLEADPETRWTLDLSYNGDREFQIYDDKSIGYKCENPGARKITLHYEIDWPLPI